MKLSIPRSGPLVAMACAVPSLLTAQTRWSLVTPYLPIQFSCVATYDPIHARAIVLNTSSNTTWGASSTSGALTMIGAPGSGPGWIGDPSLAYDTSRQRAVLFGGSSTTTLDRTWELNGTTWQQLTLAVSPPARRAAGMCFDAVAGVVRLAAGDAAVYGATPQPLSDVWTFDGAQWTQLPASASGPVGATAMAYDTVRDRCVALAANGTFEWVGGAFQQIVTSNSPPPRGLAAFVHDAFRERIVLHGGIVVGESTRSDVWEYDGNDWQQRQPLGAFVRRHSHGAVYDPELRAVRAFAGGETIVDAGGLITTSFGHAEELRYEAVSAPIVQVFASGCYFATQLAASGLPWLGESLTLTMPVAGLGIPPLMVFGESNTQVGAAPLPLPIGSLGFPNCDLLVSPDLVLSPPVSGGSASVTISIPNQAQLLGARVYVQGFEPSPTGAGTGTFGLLVQVGGR